MSYSKVLHGQLDSGCLLFVKDNYDQLSIKLERSFNKIESNEQGGPAAQI